MSTLLKLIINYPEKSWHWQFVVLNCNIPIKELLNNYKLLTEIVPEPIPWSYTYRRSDFTFDLLDLYPDIQWDWTALSAKDVPLEVVIKYIDKPWDWFKSTHLSVIPKDIIEKALNQDSYWNRAAFYKNLSLEYIEDNVDKPWDWQYLSCQKIITMDFINKHLDKPWRWDGFLDNPNLTVEFIQQHIARGWNWKDMSRVRHLPLEFIRRHRNKPWNWADIWHYNDNLTPAFIKEFMHKPWSLKALSPYMSLIEEGSTEVLQVTERPDTPINYIENHLSDYSDYYLASHNSITIEFIEAHPEIEWDCYYLSENLHMTFEFIDERKNENWDWYTLWERKLVTIEYIKSVITEYGDENIISDDIMSIDINYIKGFDGFEWDNGEPWDWGILSYHEGIDIAFVRKHWNKPWDWYILSDCGAISVEDILANLDLPWEWNNIDRTGDFPTEFILANLDKDWNWFDVLREHYIPFRIIKQLGDRITDAELSNYPFLTYEFITEHIDKNWDWNLLALNEFESDPIYILQKRRYITQLCLRRKFTQHVPGCLALIDSFITLDK